jgi:hypothetical protein
VDTHLEAIMELNRGRSQATPRVLVVADWTTDPEAVVAACVERAELTGGDFALLVPARLHGLDWVGDPAASVPCAHRQLAAIGRVADSVGFAFHAASVGDPDPVAAICDALHDRPAEELLLCSRNRRPAVAHPMDLAHRARRATGLPVGLVRLGSTARPASDSWLPRRTGHCALDQPHAA